MLGVFFSSKYYSARGSMIEHSNAEVACMQRTSSKLYVDFSTESLSPSLCKGQLQSINVVCK